MVGFATARSSVSSQVHNTSAESHTLDKPDDHTSINRPSELDSIDPWVEQIRVDFRGADLEPSIRAILEFAEKLTLTPGNMTEDDVIQLRNHDLDDLMIHDLVQVIAYFNYINRIADGLNVDLESEMPQHPNDT